MTEPRRPGPTPSIDWDLAFPIGAGVFVALGSLALIAWLARTRQPASISARVTAATSGHGLNAHPA